MTAINVVTVQSSQRVTS